MAGVAPSSDTCEASRVRPMIVWCGGGGGKGGGKGVAQPRSAELNELIEAGTFAGEGGCGLSIDSHSIATGRYS